MNDRFAVKMERLGTALGRVIGIQVRRFLPAYFDLISKLLSALVFGQVAKSAGRTSIDDRLRKLEDARANLIESLSAVDELKSDAQRNKEELQRALIDLDLASKDREAAQKELDAVRAVITADIAAFRAVAGVPSVARERIIGFVGGMFASLVASALWFAGSKFIAYILAD